MLFRSVLPPVVRIFSSTTTEALAWPASMAADNPAAPLPTTMTSVCSSQLAMFPALSLLRLMSPAVANISIDHGFRVNLPRCRGTPTPEAVVSCRASHRTSPGESGKSRRVPGATARSDTPSYSTRLGRCQILPFEVRRRSYVAVRSRRYIAVAPPGQTVSRQSPFVRVAHAVVRDNGLVLCYLERMSAQPRTCLRWSAARRMAGCIVRDCREHNSRADRMGCVGNETAAAACRAAFGYHSKVWGADE